MNQVSIMPFPLTWIGPLGMVTKSDWIRLLVAWEICIRPVKASL